MTPAQIIARLENDQFAIDDASSELDRAWRRGWNACAQHAIGLQQQGDVVAGLRELAKAPALDLRIKSALIDFDTSDVGAPDVGGEA